MEPQMPQQRDGLHLGHPTPTNLMRTVSSGFDSMSADWAIGAPAHPRCVAPTKVVPAAMIEPFRKCLLSTWLLIDPFIQWSQEIDEMPGPERKPPDRPRLPIRSYTHLWNWTT